MLVEEAVRTPLLPTQGAVLTHINIGKGAAEWDKEVIYVDGKTTSERLWNFAFELNDPDRLRAEHIYEARYWEKEERVWEKQNILGNSGGLK